MADKREKALRQDIIEFIHSNDRSHVQTDFSSLSTTALIILKAEIEARIAEEKKRK